MKKLKYCTDKLVGMISSSLIKKQDKCPFCNCGAFEVYAFIEETGRDVSICCTGCGMGFSFGWFGGGISNLAVMKIVLEGFRRRPK